MLCKPFRLFIGFNMADPSISFSHTVCAYWILMAQRRERSWFWCTAPPHARDIQWLWFIPGFSIAWDIKTEGMWMLNWQSNGAAALWHTAQGHVPTRTFFFLLIAVGFVAVLFVFIDCAFCRWSINQNDWEITDKEIILYLSNGEWWLSGSIFSFRNCLLTNARVYLSRI